MRLLFDLFLDIVSGVIVLWLAVVALCVGILITHLLLNTVTGYELIPHIKAFLP